LSNLGWLALVGRVLPALTFELFALQLIAAH
jgi:hypothetical protein